MLMTYIYFQTVSLNIPKDEHNLKYIISLIRVLHVHDIQSLVFIY